jgi:hypothetical protein
MANKGFRLRILAMALVFGLVLMGCDLGTALTTSDENGNKPLDYTKTYAFYNNSFYTVHLWDDTGDYDINAGGSATGRFNAEQSINSVSYTPANLVKVTKTGSTSFTFTNK